MSPYFLAKIYHTNGRCMNSCIAVKDVKLKFNNFQKTEASIVNVPATPDNGTSLAPSDVSVQIGVDALGFTMLISTLLLNLASAGFGAINFSKIGNTAKQNIETRIRPQDIEQNKQIEACLNRMLGVCDASRVTVAVFTNGSNAYVFSFKYFSILWEVTDHGVAETRSKYQKVPLVNIRDELDSCFQKDGQFVTYKVTDVQPDKCKNYLMLNNIHTVLSRLIGNKKDGYSGIINIQFSNPTIISGATMERIEELFIMLESMLEKKTRANKPRFLFF